MRFVWWIEADESRLDQLHISEYVQCLARCSAHAGTGTSADEDASGLPRIGVYVRCLPNKVIARLNGSRSWHAVPSIRLFPNVGPSKHGQKTTNIRSCCSQDPSSDAMGARDGYRQFCSTRIMHVIARIILFP